VHFIIILFNVGNVLICVIYQLNLPYLCMLHKYHISRYIHRSVLSAVSSNSGRSWNVLPVDMGALMYKDLRGCSCTFGKCQC